MSGRLIQNLQQFTCFTSRKSANTDNIKRNYPQEAAAKLAQKLKLKAKQAAAHRLEGSAVSGI
jgi:hypothetical protein